MADKNVSRLGQVEQSGDTDALFLEIAMAEILVAFERADIMSDKHMVKTITHGKSADFPTLGNIGASYHTPGTELLGKKVNHGEVTITIDGQLVSDAFLAEIDEAKSSYEYRKPYMDKMGYALAKEYNRNVMFELAKAARAAGNLSDTPGGTQIVDDKFHLGGSGGSADVTAWGTALATGLFTAAQTMSEKDIPEGETIWAAFRPDAYFAMAQNKDILNKLWGGVGSYSDGKIWNIGGINVLKSNYVPKLNGAKVAYKPNGAGDPAFITNPEYSEYHGADCSKTVGVIWTSDAAGTVKLMDLVMRMDYLPEKLGTLLVAKYAIGHGKVRPECAIEMCLDSLTNTPATFADAVGVPAP